MVARKEFITLGSGDLYIKLFEGGAIPEDVAFETEDNKVGEIKGGAEISYAPEIYEVLGDSGVCLKRFKRNFFFQYKSFKANSTIT